jgi:centractin
VVRAIKEKACYVALSPVKEETSESNIYQYMLPDGNKVDVSSLN